LEDCLTAYNSEAYINDVGCNYYDIADYFDGFAQGFQVNHDLTLTAAEVITADSGDLLYTSSNMPMMCLDG
jgi:hypothetical protein